MNCCSISEAGLTEKVSQRLEKYLVADDVQVVDVTPHYGLLSVQGPKAEAVVRALGIFPAMPDKVFDSVKVSDPTLGEIYLMSHVRLSRSGGFDLFVPTNSLGGGRGQVDCSGEICWRTRVRVGGV